MDLFGLHGRARRWAAAPTAAEDAAAQASRGPAGAGASLRSGYGDRGVNAMTRAGLCCVCGEPTAGDASFVVLVAADISDEVVDHALGLAEANEARCPTVGPERWVYVAIGLAALAGRATSDGAVAFGRGLAALGAVLAEVHTDCQESNSLADYLQLGRQLP